MNVEKLDGGLSTLTAGLGIETWKKKSRPCGLPYGVMCNCFRCLRARMKAGKEYERMLNASYTSILTPKMTPARICTDVIHTRSEK